MKKEPVVTSIKADNGEHGHYALIDAETGEKLWSEEPEECRAMGHPVKRAQLEKKTAEEIIKISFKKYPYETRRRSGTEDINASKRIGFREGYELAMQEYASHSAPNQETTIIAQKCPICGGKGIVPGGFYYSTNPEGSLSSVVHENCRQCNASGLIYPMSAPKEGMVLPTDEEQEAIKILKDLVTLKDRKDSVGKDSYYLEKQPLLWNKAREVLNKQPAPKEVVTNGNNNDLVPKVTGVCLCGVPNEIHHPTACGWEIIILPHLPFENINIQMTVEEKKQRWKNWELFWDNFKTQSGKEGTV